MKNAWFPWLILFLITINIIFLGGTRRAFGCFIAVLHKEYSNITLTELNLVGDSHAAFGYISSIFLTALILYTGKKFDLFQFIGALLTLISFISNSFVPSPHWMFLTHTVLNGIGSSIILSVSGLVVIEQFNKDHPHHLLATTIFGGSSFSGLLFVPFYAMLINGYGWRMTFVSLGLIYFVVNTLPAIVFRKRQEMIEMENDEIKNNFVTLSQIPLLVLWSIERILTTAVTYGLLLNLTDYIYRSQPDILHSSILTILFASGEAFSYIFIIFCTAATQNFFVHKLGYILIGSSLIACIGLVTLEFTSNSMHFVRFLCTLIGFSLGFSNTLFLPASEELTYLPGFMAYPFTMGALGFGMLISPLLTAKIAEIFEYKWFFLIQGLLIFFKVICLLLIMILLFVYKRYGLDKNNLDKNLPDQGKSRGSERSEEYLILLRDK